MISIDIYSTQGLL